MESKKTDIDLHVETPFYSPNKRIKAVELINGAMRFYPQKRLFNNLWWVNMISDDYGNSFFSNYKDALKVMIDDRDTAIRVISYYYFGGDV